MTAVESLEPASLWTRFAELTRIARPSKQEEEARAWVLTWADARAYEATTDAEGNVVVRVPASAGAPSRPVEPAGQDRRRPAVAP